MRTKHNTITNPVFYPERLRLLLGHDPQRLERLFADQDSVDLLTWNLFASLDTDRDREYLAGLLRPFGGNDLKAPVSLSLWTGKHREPLLRPSGAYVRHIRERANNPEADLSAFAAPIEVPVRIETRDLLVLVDTTLEGIVRGGGGRDRLVELIDAGATHAERVGKALSVCVVYRSGSQTAGVASARINELRDRAKLQRELPWLKRPPEVRLREVAWQQLVRTWEHERGNLRLFGQPVKDFREHNQGLGLR